MLSLLTMYPQSKDCHCDCEEAVVLLASKRIRARVDGMVNVSKLSQSSLPRKKPKTLIGFAQNGTVVGTRLPCCLVMDTKTTGVKRGPNLSGCLN